MRDTAYENREIQQAISDEREVEKASLSDRKEGQAEYLEAMRTRPGNIAENIKMVLEGNYGMGWMLRARGASKRMNRPSLFCQIVAIVDFRCPGRMAADAWKKLTKAEQARLQRLVEDVIENYDAEVAAGAYE